MNIIDEDMIIEFQQRQRKMNIYQSQLSKHPCCRDPDHPGCKKCEPEEFKDDMKD